MSIIETRTRVCDRNPTHIIETGETVQPRAEDAPPAWETKEYGEVVTRFDELCPRCLTTLRRNERERVRLERDETADEVPACEGDAEQMSIGGGADR